MICHFKKEIWKDIPGYEGLYQASNLGNIKSLDRYKQNYSKKQKIYGKILKQQKDLDGYYKIALCKNGKYYQTNVHRIIAMTFIPNPNNLPQVNHIIAISDGGTNCVDNLYWGTQKQNMQDKKRDGHLKIRNMKNENNPNSKIVLQLDLKGNVINKYNCIMEATRKTKINNADIGQCCKGKLKTAGGYKWKYEDEVINIK